MNSVGIQFFGDFIFGDKLWKLTTQFVSIEMFISEEDEVY